ncbi:MAG: helix-turn-helix domain-containing protein [Fuerstiella sp.]|nr:helix-turn-helix domain-containing protein [Fuerstiella sp.]MCP4858906.1 helix-turn-helix domain-containing protein [Fuerstiella sp.]
MAHTNVSRREGMATMRQAAEFLAVSLNHVKGLCSRQEIPSSLIGRSRRIPWSFLYRIESGDIKSTDQEVGA